MNNPVRVIVTYILLIITLQTNAQNQLRSSINFDFGWKFTLSNTIDASAPFYDDSNWRDIQLPHDWSIEDLPVSKNDGTSLTTQIIKSPFDSTAIGGKSTGFLIGGTGWNRKHFKAPVSWQNKIVTVLFDGIYMNAEIWINGHYLGSIPYGYTAFRFELSKFLNYGNKENILAIKVNNEGVNSRWYSGSGIYRHVKLEIVDHVHIVPLGISVTTVNPDSIKALINIEAILENKSQRKKNIEFKIDIFDSIFKIVSSKKIYTV